MASLKYIQSSTLQAVTLGAGYTAGSGTMTLTGGQGALLPSSGDFWLAYNNGSGTIRLFKVTARSTDTLTVVAVSGEGSGDGNISSGETLRWALTYDALTQLRADIVAQGGLVLLSSQTASSSASLNFTSIISSTYDEYQIELVNILPATDGATFHFRVSTDNGSSYVSTGSYNWANPFGSGTGTSATGSAGATEIRIGADGPDSATGTFTLNGTLKLYNPLGAAAYTTINGLVSHQGTGGTGFDWVRVSMPMGVYTATTAVDAFQFRFSSGNIASGTIRVYGLAKS